MISLILSCLLSATGQPEEGNMKKPQEIVDAWADSGVQDPMLSRVILALLLVLVLIFITLYIIKRFFKIGGRGTAKGRLRILESLPLGGKRMVQVLKVYDRTLILGVTHDRIELITELAEEELPTGAGENPEGARSFGTILPLRGQKGDMKKAKAGGKALES